MVGTKSENPSWTEPTCRPFDTISHVTHVWTAARVLQDREVRAGLVFDKSKLNKDRVLVVWLSPNDWNDGFRYGGLRFEYDFNALIEGRRAYWVESIAYGIPACRILITDIDRDDVLEIYDPTVGDGPWWRDSDGMHYRNGKFTLEFMVEATLPVARASQIDTVMHHKNMCNVDPKTCPEKGMSAADAAARILALVMSRPIDAGLLRWAQDRDGTIVPNDTLREGFEALMALLPRVRTSEFKGPVAAGEAAADALARAIAARPDERTAAAALMGLFRSRDDCNAAFKAAVVEEFGLTDDKTLV